MGRSEGESCVAVPRRRAAGGAVKGGLALVVLALCALVNAARAGASARRKARFGATGSTAPGIRHQARARVREVGPHFAARLCELSARTLKNEQRQANPRSLYGG